jgi:Rod binding domain-containing protein
MSSLSVITPQVDATAAPTATSTAELARRGQIHATAQKFEASFLTTVLQTMFQSVSTAPPFGGGEGENMWKSFLAESMAKSMARRGGIGVASSVEREMLRLQGLQDTPQAALDAGPASAGSGLPKASTAIASQTYPGLAASAQKVATQPRWPGVGAATKAPAKTDARTATIQ